MFKKDLEENLKKIFGNDKINYNNPSSLNEQGVLFIKILNSKPGFSGNSATCKVTGKLTIFNVSEKLPFGFFQKKIELSKHIDSKEFFFYNFDNNENYGGEVSLVERTVDFIYLYKEDFNPSRGEIIELEF